MKGRLFALLSLIVAITLLIGGFAAQADTVTEGVESADEAAVYSRELETGSSDVPDAAAGRKLIQTVTLSVETETFEEYVESLDVVVLESGGYVEYSNVSGGSNRWAEFVIRIPVSAMEGFMKGISKNGVIAAKSTSQEDVTLEYVDTESHVTALRTEETSLLRLLEQAESVEDIIEIQSRLTEVRYEIESCESRLRTLDNLVDYSTVNLNLRQVDRTQAVLEDPSAWEEIGANLKDNVYRIGRFFRSLFILAASALPFLCIMAAIALPVFYFGVIRPKRKRKKAEKE